MKKIFSLFNRALPASTIITLLLPSLLGVSTAFAGNVITSGTKLKVLPGTTAVSTSNLEIKNGASFNNGGLLILKNCLFNENSAPNPLGSGMVKLNGTTCQTLTGMSSFQNLVIDNPSEVVIGGDISVSGTLTLTNGLVLLGDNNLLMGPYSNISGTPSSASMIIATAAGELRKNFQSGFTGSFTFPVGDNTDTPEYSPVTLNFIAGTFVPDNYVGINLKNLKYPDPLISNNYLKRYWNVTQSGISGLNCNAVYQYVQADVVGNENLILCTKISPAPVLTYGPANINTNQLAANAILSFGTYTGGSPEGGSPPVLTGPTQVCANSTGNVYITDAGKTNYQWAISAGGTITAGGAATDNTVTISWITSGPQTVSVNYDGTSGPTILNVTVNPLLPVSVSIVASANPVCAGTSVTFTATPVNGGTTPIYQWYKGVNPVGGNSPVYSYIPVNGDAISVKLTSSATCNSNSPATSNTINMTVNPVLPVSVSIVASANPVCAGTNVTFTAVPVNGGTTPVYQWYKGVNPVGGNSPAYSYVPVNGDAISVKLTSSYTCTSNNPATSNTITMAVNPVLPVSVSIVASANPVCAGTSVTFTATPVNGGTTPVYQWYKGVNPVGGNSPVYSYIPVNGDAISVKLTSSETCNSNSPATSNTINMVVYPVLPVSVSIVASANPVCAGTSVTFTATPVNGGTTPVYQWYKGVNPVGGNSPVYSYIPVNGDAISVKLTSSETCNSNSPATSNTINMVVYPVLPVSVSIVASANPVCAGTSVTFTATPVNGGTTPVYQWYKGVNPVGGNSPVYSYTPVNGDAISVKLTSSETCNSNSPATSNTINMVVYPVLPVSVSIVASANPVCAGTSVTFTATPVNGGTTPVYQWYKGVNPVGGNSPVYSYIPVNGDAISVKLTSSETCISNSPATSNTINMVVYPVLPVSVSIVASANPVCAGTSVTFTATPVNGGTTPVYQWYKGVNPVGGNSPVFSYIPLNGDAISVKLTSSETCNSNSPATSNTINMLVNPLPVPVITGPNSVCLYSAGNIYITDPGMTGYSWTLSAGGIITAGSGTNTITVTWNVAGAQSVSVNYTNMNNCTASDATVANITVNTLPTPTITGPSSTCIGTAGVVYSTESKMTGYVWTISQGGTITNGAGTNTITVTWNATGSNFVTVNYQNSKGCSAQSPTTKTVIVHELPVPSLNGPTAECLNNTSTYYTDAGQSNYSWSVSAGGIITEGFGSTYNSVKVKWISTGPQTISVSYTNCFGCSAAAPTVMNVNVLGPTLSGPEYACKLSTNVYSTEPGMGNTYVWVISPGGIKIAGGGASDNTCTIKWIATGSRYVKVTYTNNNCTSTATLPVTVSNSSPSLFGPSYLCVDNEGTFSTEEDMSNYIWTISPGGTIDEPSNTHMITARWNVAGSHWIRVTYTSPSCTMTPTTFYLTIWDLPVPSLTGPAGPVCIGSSGNTYTTDAGKKDYSWTVSPGNIITMGGEISDNTITIEWIVPGPQYVSVNYHEKHLCSAPSPTVLNVTVDPLPVPVITGPESTTVNTTCQYNTDVNMSNYEWVVSSGGTITSGGGKEDSWITILWSIEGAQSVSVNYTNANGCSAEESTILPVTVNPYQMLNDPISGNDVDIINNLNETNKNLLPVFSVYPVPNNGKFTLSITSRKTDTYSISIINSLGVEVYNLKNLIVSGVHKQKVDINSVTEGVYMIIIRNAEGQASRRILVNK